MKKFWIIFGSLSGVALAVYLGFALFFMNHFFVNTTINGKDFSKLKVSDVEKYLTGEVNRYELTVTDINNDSEVITASEIGLAYAGNDGAEKLLKEQNIFAWPASFFGNASIDTQVEVTYDKKMMTERIDNLKAAKAEQIPPKSAYPKFDGNEYVIEPETTGTELNMNLVRGKIREAVLNFKDELNLAGEGCYTMAKFNQDSPEVIRACGELNKYAGASITYTMTEEVVVDKELISTWLSCDDEYKVTLDEDAIEAWLTDFGNTYDTVGAERTIVNPYGTEKTVSGGTYGWSINEIEEFPLLLANIKNGETVTKEPVYYQKAAAHSPQDWGTTYAEVDLSEQHMWYIKDGSVVMESDVVTGLPTPQKETTAGVFDILEMKRNATLLGDYIPGTKKREYETKVNYWMRVTWSGIGFHDALWQPGFGGQLYRSIGSHGCINMPLGQAEALYGVISVGTPVVVHY